MKSYFFIFLLFIYYGTNNCMDNEIVITEAKIVDIPSIITLRSTAEKDLKPIPESEMLRCISEFSVARVQWIIAGCVRLFSPPSCSGVLELGSLVVYPQYEGTGVSCNLIQLCETTAGNIEKLLISVTDNDRLMGKYQRRGWHEDNGVFSERLAESLGKKLFVKGG